MPTYCNKKQQLSFKLSEQVKITHLFFPAESVKRIKELAKDTEGDAQIISNKVFHVKILCYQMNRMNSLEFYA